MESTFSVLAKEIVEQRVRCRHAEERLTHLEEMLETMGVTLWETDRDLRLVDNFGMDIADSYLNCHIGDFYRDVFGIDEPGAEPIIAHQDAQLGISVTFTYEIGERQYAVLIEPKRSDVGEVVGTVGMSVRLSGDADGR